MAQCQVAKDAARSKLFSGSRRDFTLAQAVIAGERVRRVRTPYVKVSAYFVTLTCGGEF
jgi:hypothetical protein